MGKLSDDSPILKQMHRDTRVAYMREAQDLCRVDISDLPDYQEADIDDFEHLFDVHMNRYEQALIYMYQYDLLNSSLFTLQLTSVLRKEGATLDTYTPTLRHSNEHVRIGYETSDLEYLEGPPLGVTTHATISINEDDPLPGFSGSRVITTTHESTEEVLMTVFPIRRVVDLIWGDIVQQILLEDQVLN